MNPLAKKLGKRIAELRRAKDLTAEQFAIQINISKGYLSDIENGKKLPTVMMLAKLAKALGVSLKELF